MRYHHIGIPTQNPHKGEKYLEKFRVYATDHQSNPFGIQWMRYEPDSPLPELVKTLPHVAFEVKNLEQALQGKEVIIKSNSPSPGVKVAFIVEEGAPVEFIEFEKSRQEDIK